MNIKLQQLGNLKDPLFGRFIIGPLDRGQGLTLGNALRRVMLSDLKGIAITSIHFKSEIDTKTNIKKESLINNEFATFPYMKESVLEFIFNLQKIIIKGDLNTKHYSCILPLSGPRIVKAKDIPLPDNLKIINPEQYIVTILSSKICLDVELVIEVGPKSLESSSQHKLVPDAIFTPVKKVNYNVENFKVIGDTRKERLFLELFTNGSVSPREALQMSFQEIILLFFEFVEKPEQVLKAFIEEKKKDPRLPELGAKIETPIEVMNLSVRSFKCLKRAHINTIEDLTDYSRKHLLNLKNLGKKSADEICQILEERFDITLPKK
jgi:DNA-directed RNA polymerase subunit alpha